MDPSSYRARDSSLISKPRSLNHFSAAAMSFSLNNVAVSAATVLFRRSQPGCRKRRTQAPRSRAGPSARRSARRFSSPAPDSPALMPVGDMHQTALQGSRSYRFLPSVGVRHARVAKKQKRPQASMQASAVAHRALRKPQQCCPLAYWAIRSRICFSASALPIPVRKGTPLT